MTPDEVRAITHAGDVETTYDDPILDAFKDEYEDLYELARFCLVLNIPYSEAKQMRMIERMAFVNAHNDLMKEQERAAKRR